MENNHKLGLYVSYYLSRFDEEAYKNLGYGNHLETHNKIGELLSVNPNTVKNWRDEFDPLFGYRMGWHQRPMNPSRIRVALALENLNEFQIRGIVKDILSGKINQEPDEEEQLLLIASDKERGNSTQKFILRAPTGKAAEEYFQRYYSENKKPVDGKLVDCRDLDVGYDFRIETLTENYYVEIKGMSELTGGVLLTDKEWTVAKMEEEKYFLCIISNLNENPVIKFIQNPALKLNPKKNIYTSIQINWSLSQDQIAAFND
jgi:hypothetical protein